MLDGEVLDKVESQECLRCAQKEFTIFYNEETDVRIGGICHNCVPSDTIIAGGYKPIEDEDEEV